MILFTPVGVATQLHTFIISAIYLTANASVVI